MMTTSWRWAKENRVLAPWYQILWRTIWIVPYAVTLVLYLLTVWVMLGWDTMTDRLRRLEGGN